MTNKTRKQLLEEMLAESPDDPELRYGLAMESVGARQYEEAARCFEELIRRSPDYVPAYLHAGKVLAELGRTDEARAVLRTGIDRAVRKGDTHAAGEMEFELDAIG